MGSVVERGRAPGGYTSVSHAQEDTSVFFGNVLLGFIHTMRREDWRSRYTNRRTSIAAPQIGMYCAWRRRRQATAQTSASQNDAFPGCAEGVLPNRETALLAPSLGEVKSTLYHPFSQGRLIALTISSKLIYFHRKQSRGGGKIRRATHTCYL